MDQENSSLQTRFSGKKLLVFSVIPLACLLLLLMLAEISLRVFGDPRPFRLWSSVEYDGRSWLQINRGYLEKYFPANSALIPELKPTLLETPKPKNGFRVLCLGESSMFGTPYPADAGIPAIVQKQLRRLCPDRTIEVINLGASAINTNVIRDFAPQTLGLEPDVVLIYTGHNEFYGPDGIGASWLEKQLPFLTRAKYAARDLRLVRVVQRWLRDFWLSRNRETSQNLMLQVSEGSHVRSGSPEEARIVRNFGENLDAIVQLYQAHRIPVIVSDVSSNLLFAPFVADAIPATDVVPGLLLEGRLDEASSLLLKARGMDSANARTDFLLGELHLARGDTSGGREFFDRARDEDLLKFRAPSSINATIRDVCSSCGVPFVSADSALSAASPGGITGPTLFWEHLHLRLDGYYRIADLFLKELLLRRLAPSPNPEQAFASRIPCNPDSLSVCWLDEAIADLSIEGLTGRWPFNAFRPAPLVFNGADTALQHIALEVYGRQLGWNEGCVQTAAWFVAHGKPGPARTTYEAILEEYPRAYLVRYLLANLLKERGNLDQAREQYARVIAANNSYPYAHVELGLLLINAGEFRRADAELKTGLEQAMRTDAPASLKATAMYGLAAIAANRRSFDEALFLLDGSLQFSPSYQPAHDLRRQILIARKYREPKH